jgi:major vault protein
LDENKGDITTFVGPQKKDLTAQDIPVVFDADEDEFRRVSMKEAIIPLYRAEVDSYIILENPAVRGEHPVEGKSTNEAERLRHGVKENVPGPCAFALWPGEVATVVPGHRLRRNQYLYVRIYDAEEANKNPNAVYGGQAPPVREGENPEGFFVGQEIKITGEDVSFYMPPTGAEVVPVDANNEEYVRDAETLQKLEYAVLVSDKGEKQYCYGESVVYPDPYQHFEVREGKRKFRAIELSEISGVYVKVIKPYEENGHQYKEGDELFITGAEKTIYFPRPEHAVIKYGKETRHFAVAIPPGEGRYVLDRMSGEIKIERGPQMLLADPRTHVITKRVLTDSECRLLYPGNDEALEYNRSLRRALSTTMEDADAAISAEMVASLSNVGGGTVGQAMYSSALAPDRATAMGDMLLKSPSSEVVGDSFDRKVKHTKPRTVILDTKYEGVVTVKVWNGYAVQVVNRAGERRVERGPKTVLLEYDETLEKLSLSTGKPKNTDNNIETDYLKVTGNYVTDVIIDMETAEMVPVEAKVKFKVDFEGDENEWFNVDNYVKLLYDRARSIIKAAINRTPVGVLRNEKAAVIRDAILGKKPEDGSERKGLAFAENSMRVTDVDVLSLKINDEEVAGMLAEAQRASLKGMARVAQREAELANQTRLEEIDRLLAEAAHITATRKLELQEQHKDETQKALMAEETRKKAYEETRDARALAGRERQLELEGKVREGLLADHELAMQKAREQQTLALENLKAQVQAVIDKAQAMDPHVAVALERLTDEVFLRGITEGFGEWAAVKGIGLAEAAKQVLDFMPEGKFEVLRHIGQAGTRSGNGEGEPRVPRRHG